MRVFVGAITIAFVLYNWIGAQPRRARDRPRPRSAPACSGARCRALPPRSARPAGRPTRSTCWRCGSRRWCSSAPAPSSSPRMNWLKVVPYAALGQFTAHRACHLAGAVAAGDRHQPARLLAGAAHTAEAVLPGDAGADVLDLDGPGATAACGRFCAADKRRPATLTLLAHDLIRKPGPLFGIMRAGKQQWRKRRTTPTSTAIRRTSSR